MYLEPNYDFFFTLIPVRLITDFHVIMSYITFMIKCTRPAEK